MFTSWIVLFIVQTYGLFAAKRTDLHRRLGIAGAVLALLVFIVGTSTAIIRAKVVDVPPGAPSPLVFLTIPLGDMLVFAGLAGAGLYLRRRVAAHKRLMLSGNDSDPTRKPCRPPSLLFHPGDWPAGFLRAKRSFYSALLAYTISSREAAFTLRLSWEGLAIVISHPLRLGDWQHTWRWLAFATWLTNGLG